MRSSPVNVFVSSSGSAADEPLRAELEKHLAVMNRKGLVELWHHRLVTAGEDWRRRVHERLETAHVVLLLVSADFLASDYCHDVEIARSMARHDAGEALVIPIILRACDWRPMPFGRLSALPSSGRAITSWSNHDEAWENVAIAIRAALSKQVPNISSSASCSSAPASSTTDVINANRDASASSGHRKIEDASAPTTRAATWAPLGIYGISFFLPAIKGTTGYLMAWFCFAAPWENLARQDLTGSNLFALLMYFVLLWPVNLATGGAFVLLILGKGHRVRHILAIYGCVGQLLYPVWFQRHVKFDDLGTGYWLWLISGFCAALVAVASKMRETRSKVHRVH